jgi:hypothetical protein
MAGTMRVSSVAGIRKTAVRRTSPGRIALAGRLAGAFAIAGGLAVSGALPVPGALGTAQAAQGAMHVSLWRAQFPPVPAGAIASDLSAVSCATTRACTVVGNLEAAGSTFETFAETWNGTKWTVRSTPNAAANNLSGVSCTTAKACTAVGDGQSRIPRRPSAPVPTR